MENYWGIEIGGFKSYLNFIRLILNASFTI